MGLKTKCSTFDIIGRLLQEHKYSEALERLRSIDVSQLFGEALARHYIQLTHASIYSNQDNPYDDSYILKALHILRNERQSPLFAECKLYLGLIRFKTGRYDDAGPILTEASVGFRRIGNQALLGKALNLLGFAAVNRGMFDSGLSCLREAHAAFNEAGEKKHALDLFLNMGLSCYLHGRVRDGIKCLEEYWVRVAGTEFKQPIIYYSNIAWTYAVIGRFDKAGTCLRETRGLVSTDSRQMAFYYQTAGKVAELDGDYVLALDCYTKGLEIAERVGSDLGCGLRRHRADMLIHAGKIDEAERETWEAFETAKTQRDQIELGACNRTFAQVDLRRNNTDAAKTHFSHALEIFGRIDSLFELAVTRWQASMSAACPPGQISDLYLLAYNYFSREGIPYIIDPKVPGPWPAGKIPRRQRSVDESARVSRGLENRRFCNDFWGLLYGAGNVSRETDS